jgi:hypothetical protein
MTASGMPNRMPPRRRLTVPMSPRSRLVDRIPPEVLARAGKDHVSPDWYSGRLETTRPAADPSPARGADDRLRALAEKHSDGRVKDKTREISWAVVAPLARVAQRGIDLVMRRIHPADHRA